MVGAALWAGAAAVVVLAAAPAVADGYTVDAEGRFAPPTAFVPSAAVTYDQALVPAAGTIRVRQLAGPGAATTVELRVSGLKPGRTYGAYVHQRACGSTGADAGERYRNDAAAGSTAANEVRLGFNTDARGAGAASVRHGWGFRRGEAASVVIQDRPGTVGVRRVACFTVPFGWVTGMS
ncbi:superoxide dismutase family protein [Streptomyces sp. NPDC026659]|uniref:superoxide dismutase family protein n=1 Tax=Streptomyces sp. NPDC026659 TaxID=3155123 RepID=UPI003404C278